MSKPKTVDDYIDAFPAPARELLQTLRELAHTAAPETAEQLKWGKPAYLHVRGTILFVFSGYQAHANVVFTPSTREAFTSALAEFKTGKGSVQLPYDQPVPTELLARMIQYRIREFEVDGVKWI